jgi:hypothetical protein
MNKRVRTERMTKENLKNQQTSKFNAKAVTVRSQSQGDSGRPIKQKRS